MDSNSIYKKIENYVTDLFEKMHDPQLVFHDLQHTEGVVARTKEIAAHYNLNERDMLIVYAAAWFHDTGHLFTEPEKHEVMSVDVMKKFMEENAEDKELSDEIAKCIMATKFPRNPVTLLQEIICDADTYHLGTEDFKANNKKAFKEIEYKKGHLDKIEFNKGALKLLEGHQFYTDYCKDLLSHTKEKNMKKLKHKNSEKEKEKNRDKEDKQKEKEIEKQYNDQSPAPDGNKLSELEKDKSGLMSKGIQTMLRLTSENHLKLSDMADHKANILISVNTIVISVVVGVLFRKLSDEPSLVAPSIIFLATALTTIVLAILSTRPKISGGTFTHQDVLDKKTNLLFFGNFHRATFEEYDVAMRRLMVDTDYLYGSLIKDIYYLGKVLGRKYMLIRLAYNVFMIGLIISVVAFAIAIFFFRNVPANAVSAGGSPFS